MLNELYADEHEEQKGYSIPIEEGTSEIETNYIQIKEETEGQTRDLIMEVIILNISGSHCNDVIEEFAQNKLDNLDISSSHRKYEYKNKQDTYEVVIQSLMSRSKGACLTYRQKFLIYRNIQYDKNPLNQICQKYDASISTTKKIIGEFSGNVKSEEIYSGIRTKKMIWSIIVKDLIFKLIKLIRGRLTSLDIQRHLCKKLSINIPPKSNLKVFKTR